MSKITHKQLADMMNYQRRKALRRLGRGQSITNTMQADPVMQMLYSTQHYISPPRSMTQAQFAAYVEQARTTNVPRLNELGRKILAELNRSKRTA